MAVSYTHLDVYKRQLLQEALGRLGLTDPGKLSLLVSDFEPGPSFGGQMQKNWQESLSAFVNMEQLPYDCLLYTSRCV